MLKVAILRFCFLTTSVALMASTIIAQNPVQSGVPAAPVPAQILAAKKVFISNVPGGVFYATSTAEDDPYRPYNQFYASMRNWGFYELVSSPADADLILEIRLSAQPTLSAFRAQVGLHLPYFGLTVRDPKTQTVLWWLSERLKGANLQSTGEKNYNQAMTNLVGNFERLVSQSSEEASATKK